MSSSVREVLAACGLERYLDAFEAAEVEASVLADLSDDDLRELGLPLGPRRKLLKTIAARAAELGNAVGASGAERRQLTVLFCDLADSTAIAERLDPEDMSDVLRDYQRECATAISALGGTVAKYMGDGILAYFGYPVAHEDDAQRCVDAALAIVESMRVRPELHGVRTTVRIGIATGVVVVGETIGDDSSRERVAVGDTLNLAARLESLAEANGVMVSDSTKHLIERDFDLEDRGDHQLKGFSRPQGVWAVVGRRSPAGLSEQPFDRCRLIGREQEFERLVDAWANATDGSTTRLRIRGRSGLGKSRLVSELQRRVDPPHSVILQCSEPYSATPFGPVVRWLHSHPRGVPSAGDLVHRHGLFEDVAACVASLWGPPVEEFEAKQVTPARVRELTFDGLMTVLTSSDGDPMLLVVEDTHWADPSTLELLDRIVAERPHQQLLLVETTRTEPAAGEDDSSDVVLGELGDAEAMAMVTELARDLGLDAARARRMCERADGIPYFIEQLVEFARRTGADQLNDPSASVPATLHDALMARLDRLGRAKEPVLAASVIGTEFDDDLVSAAVGGEEPSVQAALGIAHEEGLIEPIEGRSGSFRFTQDLLRDTAYQSLVRERRRNYHAKVAGALAARRLHRVPDEVIAQHFALANDHGHAFHHWEQAANQAIERSASHEAAAHLRAALQALESDADPVARSERELTLQLLLGARLLALHGFAALEVEVVYTRALELASQLDDYHQLLAAYWGLLGCHVVRADLLRAAELAERFAEVAQRLDDPVSRVAAGYALGATSFYRGELGAANDVLDLALRLRDKADREESVRVYGFDVSVGVAAYAAWVLALQDDRAAASTAALAIELGRAADDPFSVAFATTFAAQTHLLLDDLPIAEHYARRTRELATERGYAQWQSQADIQLGHIAARRDPTAGVTAIQDGLDRYLATGAALALPYARAWLAEAHCQRGQTERALVMIRQGLRETAATGEHYYDAELLRIEAEIRLDEGDRGGARAVLEHARSIARDQHSYLLTKRIKLVADRLDPNESSEHD